MKVAFLTNYYNHHQKFLADEMYKTLGEGNYYLIETTEIPEFRQKLGYKKATAPYLLKYNKDTQEHIEEILDSFDVVIHTSGPWLPAKPIRERYKSGKMTFCYSERRYKSISRYLKYPIHCCASYYINRGYLLCAGAFVARDYRLVRISPERCFRWGYFPEVKLYDDINSLIASKDSNANATKKISILWCGRLIKWKHPEAAVYVAERLRDDGYDFEMNIIGGGSLEKQIKESIIKKRLEKNIHFLGSMSPGKVRECMDNSDIFLFTSDRNEGWGAVLNESMNSACAVVASDAIGAVPFLIKNGDNGLVYRNGDNEDLYQKVCFLIDNPEKRRQLQITAYETLCNEWTPSEAAQRFITLVKHIQKGEAPPFTTGPCSISPIYHK